MFRRGLGPRVVLALAALAAAGSLAAATSRSREEGDRLQQKLDALVQNAAAEPVRPKRTPASESEVDSYLTFNLREKIPRGLANPEITILGNGSLAGRVMVDIDEFKRGRGTQGFMDPLSYISGQVPVTARGVLRTREGRGQFHLASAELLGIALPREIVQELVGFFTRTRENPGGFNLEAPFNLPAKIRSVEINKGEAVAVQ